MLPYAQATTAPNETLTTLIKRSKFIPPQASDGVWAVSADLIGSVLLEGNDLLHDRSDVCDMLIAAIALLHARYL